MEANCYRQGYWLTKSGACDEKYYGGAWHKNSKGWWYQDATGWYPTSQWLKIDGAWYYFDSKGYMEANCYRQGYWLTKSGACDEKYYGGAWHKNSKGWWYQDATGWYPTSQWLKIDGKWYYFYADGYLAVSTMINGYTVDANGIWVQ